MVSAPYSWGRLLGNINVNNTNKKYQLLPEPNHIKSLSSTPLNPILHQPSPTSHTPPAHLLGQPAPQSALPQVLHHHVQRTGQQREVVARVDPVPERRHQHRHGGPAEGPGQGQNETGGSEGVETPVKGGGAARALVTEVKLAMEGPPGRVGPSPKNEN